MSKKNPADNPVDFDQPIPNADDTVAKGGDDSDSGDKPKPRKAKVSLRAPKVLPIPLDEYQDTFVKRLLPFRQELINSGDTILTPKGDPVTGAQISLPAMISDAFWGGNGEELLPDPSQPARFGYMLYNEESGEEIFHKCKPGLFAVINEIDRRYLSRQRAEDDEKAAETLGGKSPDEIIAMLKNHPDFDLEAFTKKMKMQAKA